MAAPRLGTVDHLGRDSIPVLNFLFNTVIAAILGMLAGMGVGGGSLLLLWLTQIATMSMEQARLINLLFYLPTAVICTLLRKKQHTLQIKPILPAMIAGCSAAFLFSIISSGWNLILMKKLLGILLIGIGIRELIYRPRNAK